ncbi:hypothetical protein GCM10011348_46420 [Marinobacterium nitratireducens]|uniref:Uncharacterized protein n=1 Tax=Marinobacterium nitratireducens TaxID=518897 RepID=A0A918DZ41_9GAMM|nr:hypothetical protein [Marinobacterium nitratireducens]GGO89208.1 hypothetical protein GCM10011348_46420 [Marinobacterium nitratireducens]
MNTQSAQLRIKELEEQIRELNVAYEGMQAQRNGYRQQLSVAEREKGQLWDQAQTLSMVAIKLGLKPGPDAIRTVPEVVLAMMERRDSLFSAIEHGDDEHRDWLKEAIDSHFSGNPCPPCRGFGVLESVTAERDELRARLDHITEHATHAARSQLCRELTELFDSDQIITVEQVVDLIAAPEGQSDAA